MPALTLVKRFTYRGQLEEWTNTYHFDGGDPVDATHWKALADAVILKEKTCYTLATTVERAIGHKAGVLVADWTYDYRAANQQVPGTFGPAANEYLSPGDVAVWIRWTTTQRTSKGKPIYLRSYYHAVWHQGTPDLLAADQAAALASYGAQWVAGFSDGSVTHHRAGPNGAVGQAAQVSTYMTTRTLKRRGPRP